MVTVDRTTIRAPLARVFDAARDVERWPSILPHYRWVRFLSDRLVEMAAWRPFGPLRYPTWWVSEMTVHEGEIRYRHVRGITRGMDVAWRLRPDGAPGGGDVVHVEVVHEWAGPPWPLIGAAAANLVIGPVFVHGIAARTLAGLRRHLEAAS